MNRIVYFDNNATTQVAPEVRDVMQPFFNELYGNPSSMHAFGGEVAKYIDRAREEVARFINADPDEIVFTSCATESDNAAIRGAADYYGPSLRVITTAVEHPAVLQPCRRLKALGHEVIELPVSPLGHISLSSLETLLASQVLPAPAPAGAPQDSTRSLCSTRPSPNSQFENSKIRKFPTLVSIMWANNETGVVNPMREIAALCRKYGAILHTDAVQVAGKIPVDVKAIDVDMLSMSGHKFHAPKGIGILYIKKGTKLKPFMLGGHQERVRRAGTENVPYIVGLAKACELARLGMDAEAAQLTAMRHKLEAGILAACPNVRVNGDPAHRLPNTLNLSFEYIEGEAIAYHLSDLGICISTGSACASGSLDPSHVIRAMGVPFIAVHGSVRFSLSRYNTMEEVDYVLEKLPPVIKRLRDLSPFNPTTSPSTFQ